VFFGKIQLTGFAAMSPKVDAMSLAMRLVLPVSVPKKMPTFAIVTSLVFTGAMGRLR
jgi:hypothetical protein